MSISKNDCCFSAGHHALLFTCIAKAIMTHVGETDGAPIIRQAVRKYGEQRGGRMALRAKKNGHSLTFDTYLAYGEWELPKGDMAFEFTDKVPHACLHVFKCPWHGVWKEKNLLEYGKYFCQEIDAALVRGFNKNLEIEVKATQTNGAEYCNFIFKDASLTLLKLISLAYKKKIKPGKDAIMPWEYHTGHLLKTLGDFIRTNREDEADDIMETALSEFAGYFSENHAIQLKKYQATDFGALPD